MSVKNFSIGSRLLFGFGFIVLITIMVGGIGLYQLNRLSKLTNQMYQHPFVVSNAVRDINTNIVSMQGFMKDVALAENPEQVEIAVENLTRHQQRTLHLFQTVSENFLGDMKDVTQAQEAFLEWGRIRAEVVDAMRNGKTRQAAAITQSEGKRHVAYMMEKIQSMIDFAGQKAAEFNESANKAKAQTLISMTIFRFISFFIGLSIAVLITRSITLPLKSLISKAIQIAKGERLAVHAVTRRDEIGQLATSLNAIIASSDKILVQAQAVTKGDYDKTIELRSEQDELGKTLNKMISFLKSSATETKRQTWIREGRTGLNDQMRSDKELVNLCDDILTFVADYTQARVGAIYLLDGQTLQLKSSYAYMRRKHLSNQYRLGESLVGQTGLEQKPIVVTEVPPDYLQVTSGLGASVPGSIVLFPLVYQGRLKGVIELGYLQATDNLLMTYLEKAAPDIAIAIHSAQSRNQLHALLEKSQRQSEALQAREEELRQTNQELEEQSLALKQSEARLQVQQEELLQTNEELEEQTQRLEEQKESIEKKNQELHESQRVVEGKARELELSSRYKSEFLANMSHELRTPLNSILLLSRMMIDKSGSELDDDLRESAQTINTSGMDLLNLINEVLDLSKIEAGKMQVQAQDLDLNHFLTTIQREFAPLAREKKIDFKILKDDTLPQRFVTDEQRLKQILKNLLSNAFKFTSQGSINFGVARMDMLEDIPTELLPPGYAPRETLCFWVKDSGIGIPKKKQHLIFEAFQQVDGTTSRQYGGTGLGLSISRELTKLLGGAIRLHSIPGQGSGFFLFLPLTLVSENVTLTAPSPTESRMLSRPPKAVHPQPKDKLSDPASICTVEGIVDDRKTITPETKSILVIEDDASFCRILKQLSHDHGFKCIVAGDGETGLQLAFYYRPSAIILDIGLPGINGWSVMTRLKDAAETRHIPVHVISGDDKSIEAMKMGAIDYVTKPVSPKMIETVFKNIDQKISKTIKDLLVVEDNASQQKAIAKVIGNGDVRITEARTAAEAYELMTAGNFDCTILDLGLPDMSGVDLLEKIRGDETISQIPVVIYTGRELSQNEKTIIDQYAASTIIKGVNSEKKLLDETTLFLHRVENNLREDQKRVLAMLHNKEAIFKKKQILIVDDDMRNVYSLKKVLEEKQMRVIVAKNGIEALAKIDASSSLDCVLMDIMMPEMDGYEAMTKIRSMERFNNLPIIALTAKAMRGDRAKCMQAGASDYLAKPVDVDRLFSILRVWLY